MIEIYLSLLFCKVLIPGEAASFCTEQFSFICVYHIMAFQLPFAPLGSFVSHALSLRQLVTPFPQMRDVWASARGGPPEDHTASQSQPRTHAASSSWCPEHTVELQGGHRGDGVPCTCRGRIATKCPWKNRSSKVKQTWFASSLSSTNM